MSRGRVTRTISARAAWRNKTGLVILAAFVLTLFVGAMILPVFADGDGTISFGPPPAAAGDDFGQYLADHESELSPFFEKNAEDLGKQGVPVLIEMTGWIVVVTMAIGWIIDVLLSRGFAFFFAPAFADIKRSLFYATGRLFLSFVYTGLTLLAIVFSLKLPHAGFVMLGVVILLLLVAFAAQLVWILYLYRTSFAISFVFYLAIVVAHSLVGFLIARPLVGMQASGMVIAFVDQVITPKLQAEAQSTRQELATADSARNAIKQKVSDLQNQITQAKADADQVRQQIEDKKNSDIYIFSRIIQARTRGELDSAREQLAAFPSKFPSSNLDTLARTQLTEVNEQIALADAQKKQDEADAAKAAAAARAELLAHAVKGEATLSEMRQALIGKTRAQVSSLLGLPSDTASDSWGYRKQMILNPLTNAHYGLMVYFDEGIVQSVDYDRNGGLQ